jgi:SAM-dependent methyltransferase
MADLVDRSNGYDQLAEAFIERRRESTIGVATVREWASTLPRGAAVIDLGCGDGVPIARTLIDAGCRVHAVDASPRMVAAFRARFPDVPVACEAIEASTFFDREFDAAIACGLMFLLPLDTQAAVIHRIAHALKPGGNFLFTSPSHACSWQDVLTGRTSISPGAGAYRRMLAEAGLSVTREMQDEGDNHYYASVLRQTSRLT